MVRSLLIAVLGLSALSSAATECGVNHTDLMKPFAGRWQDDTGDYYDIAPGSIGHKFTLHLVTGDEVKHDQDHFVLSKDPDGDDIGSVLECRELTAMERDKIGAGSGQFSGGKRRA